MPFVVLILLSIFLVACGPLTAITEKNTPSPATEAASVPNTPTRAVSKLNVEQEALRGVRVQVWHPWFGAQASLFESQVAQFNKENEWGIVVSADGKENYSELFLQTTNALKDSSNPQVVIALPGPSVTSMCAPRAPARPRRLSPVWPHSSAVRFPR